MRPEADARRRAEAEHPDQPHAGHVEQRAPDERHQHGLAEIGLQHQQSDHDDQHRQRKGIGRHFRPAAELAEQPGDQHHEGGLEKLRRLHVDAEDHQPAPRPFDLGAEERRHRDQHDADDEHDERQLADFARRQKRGRDQDGDGRNEEHHLAVDEMERVEPDARGDRRARREAQHDAAEHQRAERGERQPVDRAPPFAQRCRLRARGHGVPFNAKSPHSRGTISVSRRLMKLTSPSRAAPAPAPGRRRRGPRNCDIGRTRRRPARAGPPARARRRLRRRGSPRPAPCRAFR